MRRAALLLVAVAFFSAANCLGCIDNTGKNVLWWAKFKLPNSRDYYYSSSTAPGLKKASEDLSTATSPLWRTVNAGRKLSNPAYFYYNDETPDEVQAGSKAHAKGVIYVDTDASGFWLVHSVPRFPTKTQSDFPDWSIIYAQSFLCVSLKTQKEWASLMTNLVINWPQVYEYSVPSWFSSFAPDSNNLVGDRQPAGIPTYRVAPLQGGAFMAFAKDNSWADNLYGALVAPTIKANMLVESWGRPLMAPACDGQYTVNNVLSVTFPGGTVFTETQDHSKWGISTKGSWVCIGDINRMTSQTKRGGGTLCFFNADLWNSLKASITTQDQCN